MYNEGPRPAPVLIILFIIGAFFLAIMQEKPIDVTSGSLPVNGGAPAAGVVNSALIATTVAAAGPTATATTVATATAAPAMTATTDPVKAEADRKEALARSAIANATMTAIPMQATQTAQSVYESHQERATFTTTLVLIAFVAVSIAALGALVGFIHLLQQKRIEQIRAETELEKARSRRREQHQRTIIAQPTNEQKRVSYRKYSTLP